jgi:hypothetical protein
MPEEDQSPTVEARPPDVSAASEDHPKTDGPVVVAQPESPPEGHSKGVLRDAIQKVMEEIEHHEREAKRHLQQAEDLRKDLRESFAFMLQQEGEGTPSASPEEKRSSKATDPGAPEGAKEVKAEKRPRPGKKPPARKTKGG